MIKQILNFISNDYPVDDIDLIIDDKYPFPVYELEVEWDEWRWNDARTDRLDETITQGITINPDDFADPHGRVDHTQLGLCVIGTLVKVINNPERVGMITIKG